MTDDLTIRPERPDDVVRISTVVRLAFEQAEHASGNEPDIVSELRAAGALHLSWVAEVGEEVVAHVAISPVGVSDGSTLWFGLGPVAVLPGHQRKGIGSALIRAVLEKLRQDGASGCVVLGDPAYYRRFGFVAVPGLRLPDVPPAYFQALAFDGRYATGVVAYAPAFSE